LPGSFGPRTKNEALRAFDDKQTRTREEEEAKKREKKLRKENNELDVSYIT